MKPLPRSRVKVSLILMLAGISSLLAVSPKEMPKSTRLDGRLIAVDPVSPEGAMCELPQTSGPAPEARYATNLVAAAFAQGTSTAPRGGATADEAKRAEV